MALCFPPLLYLIKYILFHEDNIFIWEFICLAAGAAEMHLPLEHVFIFSNLDRKLKCGKGHESGEFRTDWSSTALAS